jgi:alkylation response protein AidB-like acyl-CoA dehydrogenase
MHTNPALPQIEMRTQRLITGLAEAVPAMQRRALDLDQAALFPAEDFASLRAMGALAAPLPAALGGLGMGTEPGGALALMEVLRLLGRGNLSVGRLFEAHVNAVRLIVRAGTEAQARNAAADALDGHLFGLWVTDLPGAPLLVAENGLLEGEKNPCSGAGHVTRALVTAETPAGVTVMHVIALDPGARADLSAWDPHGMRASVSGRMDLRGIAAGDAVGPPGAYLAQPDFSAGAWRGSAVTLGGIEALVAILRETLVARGRAGDPHQLARVGEALIAQETARLWVRRAALLGEAASGEAGDIANTINLARIAVENACLDVIRITQRALGMGAFRRGATVELLFRDLAMYLRQPAPDETLTEAAAYFMQRDLPPVP